VVRTFQAPQNWLNLSVLENVALGSPDRAATGLLSALVRRRAVRRHERDRWAAAAAVLDRVGLTPLAGASASVLTYGQQRLLELARAMVAEPKVLLLDEPAAGLNAAETGVLAELLAGLGREGVSCVVVDHKIDFLDAICARIVVLQLGAVIAEGPPVEIWHQPGVIDAYLGRSEADAR
jgi:ABC-type branched-subunit amino acid transport system ATPase component